MVVFQPDWFPDPVHCTGPQARQWNSNGSFLLRLA